MEAAFIQASEMLAASLPIIKGTTVPGTSTLVKKNDWDIFGTDEAEDIE